MRNGILAAGRGSSWHITPLKSAYASLTERLNRFPQGAPPSELLEKILRILFSEREAKLVALLPIRPFTAEKAAGIWKMPTAEARKILDGLADKAILLDTEEDGKQTYVLPPPMAGFFEFSLMRIRGDIDQKALSELYYQYLNVEEAFIKALFTHGETQLGRVFVHEPSLYRRELPSRPRLRAGERGDPHRLPPGGRHLLLPPQDGTHRTGLRRADGDLHDVQQLRRLPDPPRLRPRH